LKLQQVYLFNWNGKRATKLFSEKVEDMRTTEAMLHKKFASKRINRLTDNVKPTFRQQVVKIGLSEDPARRLREVNKDPYKSGDTEWFYLTKSEISEAKNFIRSDGKIITVEGKMVRWILIAAAASLTLIFSTSKTTESKEDQNNFIELVKTQYNDDKSKNQRFAKSNN
jgi:hypothetical protein